MPFTKLNGQGHTQLGPNYRGVDYVSELDNKPNDVGGLNPEQLKAVFDQAGMEIQAYLNNTLTAELEAQTGAGNIGISAITGLTATTVQAALAALKTLIDNVSLGHVTVGTNEIINLAVTTDKLDDNAVTAAKIKDGEVGENELAGLSVSTNKLQNGAVTADKLGAASVTAGKLASNAVGNDNLAGDLLVPVGKGGTGATTADGAISQLGAQKAIQSNSFSLTTDNWTARAGGGYTKTVTVSGMTASKAFVASPSTEAAWKAAADAELYPPTAGDGTLTFTCANELEAAVTITVYFW